MSMHKSAFSLSASCNKDQRIAGFMAECSRFFNAYEVAFVTKFFPLGYFIDIFYSSTALKKWITLEKYFIFLDRHLRGIRSET